MHPIFKEKYVELGVLSWIKLDNIYIYLLDMMACVLCIVIVGIICSIPVKKAAKVFDSSITNKIDSRIESFIKHK